MPGLDVWHVGLSVVGFCITILNIGHANKLQTRKDMLLHVWLLNIKNRKMSNDAIGGWILNIQNRKMSNDAIGGRILNNGTGK